jgi:hypothetical protein
MEVERAAAVLNISTGLTSAVKESARVNSVQRLALR